MVFFIVVLAAVMALLMANVHLEFTYEYISGENHIRIRISYLRLFHYSHVLRAKVRADRDGQNKIFAEGLSSIEPSQNKSFSWDLIAQYWARLKEVIQKADGFFQQIHGLLNALKVRKFTWLTEVGLDFAPDTAFAAGMAWATMGSATALAMGLLNFYQVPDLQVMPVFDRRAFATRVSCIVDARLGKAIYAGFRLLFVIIRTGRKKGGAHGGTSSDTVTDANSDGEYQGNG